MGWMPRPEVSRIMCEEADVFVFPSLHDQSPWVLHEARAAGLPVVCLEGCGSNLLATVTVPVWWPRATARALAHGVAQAKMDSPPVPAAFDIDTRRECLTEVLRAVGFRVEQVS
jgi:glycosyltransferase involved in cell wall biosynthesis